VASRHRTIIDQLQPYQRGVSGAPRDPLYLLNAVANREKHEDTHAVWAAVAGTKFRLLFSDGRVYNVVISKDDDPNPLMDGQTLVGADGSDLLPGQSIRIELDEVRIGLAFEGKVKVSPRPGRRRDSPRLADYRPLRAAHRQSSGRLAVG
jgi:hypothetical protein